MILFIEYSMEELSLAQHIMVDWSYGMFNMVNRALMGLFVNFKKKGAPVWSKPMGDSMTDFFWLINGLQMALIIYFYTSRYFQSKASIFFVVVISYSI